MIKDTYHMNPLSKACRYMFAALLVSSVPAFAQDNSDEVEEVEGFVVVGSNIERMDLETVSPVINLSGDDLEATGFSTVGDAIRALPITSGQSLTTTDAGTSFTPGVSSVNLRGLGNNNTLALLNGRRVAPYATPGFNGFQNVVDFSSIPAKAIDSVQVLKDGASAVYGSDAVAGVISVNLVKEYDGLTTKVSMGNTLDSDSFEWDFFAIGGATSGRASVVFTVDYRERNDMFARDIDWTSTADGSAFGGFDQRSSANISANARGLDSTAYDGRFPSGRASWAGLPLANAEGALPAASYIPTLDDFEDGNKFYNYQENAGMFPKVREYGFYTRLNYAVTDTLDAYAEVSFRRVETEIAAAATPAFFGNENGDSDSDTLVLPSTNPYNPFGVDLTDVRWRIIETGNRVNDLQADTPRIVLGLQGDLPLETWSFDSAFLITESEITNTNPGTVFDSLLQEALNGITINGEMFYANPWGRNYPEVIDYITGTNPVVDSFMMWSWDFKANGDLFDMGDMGVIRAAAGVEYRYEELASVRTIANETGDIVGGSESTSVFGERDIKSLYAEVSIPVYDLMEFQVAARYEDYSDFGDTTKPKIGMKFTPVEGLLLRAAYGQSFRAPDLPFLYSSGSVSFTSQFLNDPLRPSDPPNQIKTRGGGNIDLQPEETDSTYVGVVVDMGKFFNKLDGLSFEVDLWKFEQTDVISRISANTIVANAGNPFYDAFITRLPPGPGETIGLIQEVSTQWQNLESQETQGIDLAVSYTLSTENYGEYRFKVEGTYVDEFTFVDSEGNTEQWAGTWTQPRWRANGTIAWNYGDWAASMFISWVGEYEELYLAPEKVKSYWRFNPQVSYSGIADTKITFGVRNVFDEEPPVDTAETTTRGIGVHNIEPRFWYLRLEKDW
jgi:iron complex outermembrane receptor protein